MKAIAGNNPLHLLILMSGLIFSGCLTSPFPDRLNEENQKRVDQAWDEFAKKQKDLSRQEILDVMMAYRLYFEFSDRVHLVSEKETPFGTFTIESIFQRDSPEKDRFSFRFTDTEGQLIREELYTREEVKDAENVLVGSRADQELNPNIAQKNGGGIYNVPQALLDENDQKRLIRASENFPIPEPSSVSEQ